MRSASLLAGVGAVPNFFTKLTSPRTALMVFVGIIFEGSDFAAASETVTAHKAASTRQERRSSFMARGI
jgi:hypothetical protein